MGRREVITCLSQGGQPRPVLQAFFTRDNQRRPLQQAGQDLTGQSHSFHYIAEISDRSAGGSYIECEGIQRAEDDILYRLTAKQQINVVFPPQPADITTVVAQINETLQIDLTITASLSPIATTVNNVVWNIMDGDTSAQVKIFKLLDLKFLTENIFRFMIMMTMKIQITS